jgi:uncharacterized membrane protein YkvA (DUF1232 family)
MSQTAAIRAIIGRERARGAAVLAGAVRSRHGAGASAAEVDDAVGFRREIIDAVPLLLDTLREAAREQGIGPLVEPMLAQAETYFVSPLDAMPEALLGELGLLDDAYLALRVISLLQSGEQALIRVDLAAPLTFLEQLLGETVLATLKAEEDKAVQALVERAKALDAATAERRPRPAPTSVPASGARPAPRPTGGAVQGRQMCGVCSGLGSDACPSCGGHGYHTSSYSRVDWQGNTEYVTERTPCGCAGGRMICSACGGSGYR